MGEPPQYILHTVTVYAYRRPLSCRYMYPGGWWLMYCVDGCRSLVAWETASDVSWRVGAHTAAVTAVSTTGHLGHKKALTSSDDGSVRVWDWQNSCCLHMMLGEEWDNPLYSGPYPWVKCVVALEDGRIASAGVEKVLRVWA